MKQIGILTSGGDTPGMNAAIRAVVKTAYAKGMQALGVIHGYKGLIEGDIRPISEESVDLIAHKGGTILKTARSKEFTTDEGLKKALKSIKAFNLEGLVVIGGDGSLKGARKLSENGVCTIGLPGTIDNDLYYTDYTIGFDTARNNVVEQIYKIRDTMTSHDRIGVIEVMGNHCGDIALHAGMACGVEAILIPEMEFNYEQLADKLSAYNLRGKKTCIVVVAEGVCSGNELATMLKDTTGLEVKGIVLGYTQRGGDPTAFDRLLATRAGVRAIELLVEGKTNRAVGIREDRITDYDIGEALDMPSRFDNDLYEMFLMLSQY